MGIPFTGAAGEEFAEVGRGIRLCLERFGDPAGPPVLLVAGLGQQLHAWPTDLCTALTDEGFAVVRFDNRDSGRSTHVDLPPPGPWQLLTGRFDRRQYHLGDMARDVVGLLDALELPDAHLVGMSLGGMVAQTVAAHFPSRVRSLTSLISATGAPRQGRIALSTWPLLLGAPPADRAAAADAAVRVYRHIGSHGFGVDEAWVRAEAEASWDRDPGASAAAGSGRQMAAVYAVGDRTAELAGVRAPTLVVHGDRDRMVDPGGGRATARAIAGARLVTVSGMGHDLPEAVRPRIAGLIRDHARAADAARATPTGPAGTPTVPPAAAGDTTRRTRAATPA